MAEGMNASPAEAKHDHHGVRLIITPSSSGTASGRPTRAPISSESVNTPKPRRFEYKSASRIVAMPKNTVASRPRNICLRLAAAAPFYLRITTDAPSGVREVVTARLALPPSVKR